MRYFPVFLDLQNRLVVVLGTGAVAQRKAEALRDAGAVVELVAEYSPDLLEGCELAVGAEARETALRALYADARARGIPVNVVDRPELCSCIMPAIVDRDPLLVAVSSSAAAPVLARLARARIEAAIPPEFGALAAIAERFKDRIRQELPDMQTRRRVLERAFSGRVAELAFAGDQAGAAAALEAELAGGGVGLAGGSVHFISAGSGEADLLTLRAQRLLGEADAILPDPAVPAPVLALGRRDATRIDPGPDPAGLLIQLARQGLKVMRLRSGAPDDGQEAARLRAAGIVITIVPAIMPATTPAIMPAIVPAIVPAAGASGAPPAAAPQAAPSTARNSGLDAASLGGIAAPRPARSGDPMTDTNAASSQPTPPAQAAPSGGAQPAGPLTLGIDVGGTRLKCGILDRDGRLINDQMRVSTPKPATPDAVIAMLLDMAQKLGAFDRISIGFPGVVRGGSVVTAPNLGTESWRAFPLAATLSEKLGSKPARMLNDGSVQGLGVVSGHGLECVITLGTGVGFALFSEGRLAPHLELGQHIARKDKTYDQYIGNAAMQEAGPEKWNRRVQKAIAQIDTLVGYDTLYIGGGNAKHINFELPSNVQIVSNKAGITGGAKLWDPRLDEAFEDKGPQVTAALRRA